MKPLKTNKEEDFEREYKERLFPFGGDSYDFDTEEFYKILHLQRKEDIERIMEWAEKQKEEKPQFDEYGDSFNYSEALADFKSFLSNIQKDL